jgi:hypothetical protein
MTQGAIDIVEALRVPDLCRKVCAYAGLPAPAGPAGTERFIFRSGYEAPELLQKLLEEGFAGDEVEVAVYPEAGHLDYSNLPAGKVIVQQGFPASCLIVKDLQLAAGGRGLFFAVERRNDRGELLGAAWVALSEEPESQDALLKAAVSRQEFDVRR